MSEHQLKLLGKKFEYLHPCSWCSKICYYKETVSENIMHPILTNLTMISLQILSFQQNVHCSSAPNRQNSTHPQILTASPFSPLNYKLIYNYMKTPNYIIISGMGKLFSEEVMLSLHVTS
jgi:hypothetical protein